MFLYIGLLVLILSPFSGVFAQEVPLNNNQLAQNAVANNQNGTLETSLIDSNKPVTLDQNNQISSLKLSLIDNDYDWSTNLVTEVGRVRSMSFNSVEEVKNSPQEAPANLEAPAVGFRIDFFRTLAGPVRFSYLAVNRNNNLSDVQNNANNTNAVVPPNANLENNSTIPKFLTNHFGFSNNQNGHNYTKIDGYPTKISVWIAGRGLPFKVYVVLRNKKGNFLKFPLESEDGFKRLNFMGFKKFTYSFSEEFWASRTYADIVDEEFSFVGFDLDFKPLLKTSSYYIYFSDLEIESNNYFQNLWRTVDSW